MTSSLVGSEMCIRDSSEAVQRATRTHRGKQGGQAGEGRGSANGDGGTVSYTHLTLPTICSV
eukprot:9134804-Prorocentrum_lima.AAC.1